MLSVLTKSAMTASAAAGCLLMAAGSANAFTFDTNWSGAPPKGDILLESVEIGSEIITDFALVNSVSNFTNSQYTGGNTGAASSDQGDDATNGTAVEDPMASDVVTSLGNPYLSSIVDTEDSNSASFSMDLNFDKAFSQLLFWERGINSDLGVTINGVTKILTRQDFAQGETTYTLDTTEIGGAQKVGSYGVDLSDFGITGKYSGPVTIFSNQYGYTGFNGPDFKVVGVADVPEPATILGLTAIAGAAIASRRRRSERSA
ncbi:MAG: exosortase-dependent surface protein XDP2 [Cyanobacteria bacterium P01_D01_bin.71]